MPRGEVPLNSIRYVGKRYSSRVQIAADSTEIGNELSLCRSINAPSVSLRHGRTEFRATSLHARVYMGGLHVKYACKLDQQIGLRSPSKLISVPLVTRDPIRRA